VLAVALLAPGARAAAACGQPGGTPIVSYDAKPGAPRVFAMQFRQDPRKVVTYATFRRAIDCMLRTDVVPRLAHGRPNLVVFTEDIGLMTGATGTRGATARALWSSNPDIGDIPSRYKYSRLRPENRRKPQKFQSSGHFVLVDQYFISQLY